MRKTILSLLFGIAVGGQGTAALAQSFDFTDSNQRNTVSLLLDAPFESIRGVANGVEGRVDVNGGQASGQFKVRVDSIKTGNESRDGHLQNDKWLNAGKWPHIEFSFAKVPLPADFTSGRPMRVKVKGAFFIHGVRRDETVDVQLTYLKASELTANRLPGNLVRVQADFDVRLADYGVAQSDSGVKSLLGLKVGEIAKIGADFFGTDAKN